MDDTELWSIDPAHDHERAAEPGLVGALFVTCGRRAGSSVRLQQGPVTLGRHHDATLVLDDPSVSRHHVAIRPTPDGGYELEDLGSVNGTYVNGQRVARAVLQPGDELQVGRFCLVYLARPTST